MISFSGLQLSRLRNGIYVFISLIILWLFSQYFIKKTQNLNLNFEPNPNKYIFDFNTSNKCFEHIDFTHSDTNFPNCFSHTNKEDYFHCHIKYDLINKSKCYTLVLGSAFVLGKALVNELQKNNESVIEIKQPQHINLLSLWFYEALDRIPIKNIYLIQDAFTENELEYIIANLNEYYFKYQIRIVTNSKTMMKKTQIYQILFDKNLIGAYYYSDQISQEYDNLYKYTIGISQTIPNFTNISDNFVSSISLAKDMIFMMNDKNSYRSEISQLKPFPFLNFQIILNNSQKIQQKNRQEVEELYKWMKENHEMSKKPYAEIVNFVDQDNSTQIQQLEKLYNYYSYMIDKLVDLPLQFVLFYCSSSNERLLSSKSLNISHNIRSRLKIYSIDNVSMRQLNLWKVFKDNQYLVNLAAWMTDCEYIFYSNLDFYPSFSFFYAIERKLLTPFSIFLFPSTTVSEIDQKQLKESKHIESSISFQNSTKIFTIENMVRTGLNGMFGSSKILLRAIDGFKDKFTFVMSIYSLKVPPIIKTFVGSQTLSTTYDIPLPYKSIEMQENLCKGAHFKKNNKTPHYLWGRSYEFIDSTRKSERYGHIAFNVIETTNNTNTIEIYTYFTDEI